MKFNNRADLESVGKANAGFTEEDNYFVCKTLNSFYICAIKGDLGYTKHAKEDGYWESWISFWMLNNVSPGSRVADIGANHGYYSLMLSAHGCKVDAFEPQKDLCDLISKSAEINNFDINVISAAVSDRSGKDSLMLPNGHGMNATIHNNVYTPFSPEGMSTVEVDTVTLDDFIDTKYDFIKIDAEGGEVRIWNGMQKYLDKYQNLVIMMEWRYDRYKDPEGFISEILNKFHATAVNLEGNEEEVNFEKIVSVKNSDWMLILRRKI